MPAIHLDCMLARLHCARHDADATQHRRASSLHSLSVHEVALLHSEVSNGLPDRDSEPPMLVQHGRRPRESRDAMPSTVPLRFRAAPNRPIRSRRGPVVVFGVLLLIAVAAKFSTSFFKIEASVLLRSGFSLLAVLIAVYVAALIAIVVVIERRHRARSQLKRQQVVE